MLPRIPGLKEVVFCKRIVVLNETFAPVGGPKMRKGRKPTGVLWHEGIKGRNASDVASRYLNFIRSNRDINDFVFGLITVRARTRIGTCLQLLQMRPTLTRKTQRQ